MTETDAALVKHIQEVDAIVQLRMLNLKLDRIAHALEILSLWAENNWSFAATAKDTSDEQ